MPRGTRRAGNPGTHIRITIHKRSVPRPPPLLPCRATPQRSQRAGRGGGGVAAVVVAEVAAAAAAAGAVVAAAAAEGAGAAAAAVALG